MKKITLLCAMLLVFAWQGRAQFPAPYCGPITFTNNEEPITLVQFAGINNSSPAPVGGVAHQDFTAISGTVMQGISYPITLKGNTDGNYTTNLNVWIDWNQNNVFTDAGEMYEIGTITNSTGLDATSLTGNIAVPATATLGSTRMRVIKKFNGYSDSCNTVGSGWGEAEDYSLTVVAATCTPPTVAFATASLCPSATFNVTVNVSAMGSATSYTVTDNQGSASQNIAAAGTLTFGPYVSSTDVVITVTDPNSALCNTTSDSLTDVCLPGCASNPSPANGSTSAPGGPITLTWDAPTTGGAVESYDLYAGNTSGALEFVGNYTTNTTGDDLVINAYGVTVYWQVIAINAAGEATGCAEWNFTVQSPPGWCLTAPNGLWPAATFTPATCDGTTENVIANNAYAGEYSNVNVTSGQTYVFKSGTTDFITISNAEGNTALAYGATPLTWVSTLTGTVRFLSHVDDQCGAEATNRVRSVICGVVSSEQPDWASLQWPPNATISQGGSFDVYGQVYEPGVTDPAGAAAGMEAWVGINTADTDPSTWSVTWIPMTFNALANSGNNDEFMASVGSTLAPGAYFYATRFRLNNGPYVYGGIDATNAGGIWNGTQYGSGELTVNPPTVPDNDLCGGALALTPGGVFADNAQTGTLLGSTTTAGLTFNCQTNRADDVWYSVVVPASGSITIETLSASGSLLTDTVLSVFSGSCGTLTEIGCSDDEGTDNFSVVSLTGQTPGATLYVGVWRWNNAGNPAGAFQVSAYDASLSTGEIRNDGFSYYPNPVSSVFNVSAQDGIKSVSVFNMLGQQVMQKNINAQQGSIDMSSLAKGAYLVKLYSDNASKTIKVLKD
ncbi:T9SS type A sorting domain-containing protein [Flavobacterium sp. MAH-1]|uniref:T9SS type A sorting domain-containing protein n=1 Tax=Flavobacterium agri TaxID=2743471 RepID=A0A7Y8Y4L7_9FLAO|nr:GEVED domain-containing protein [Flavobacterium agri]NUY82268.1 T9SS type A sorting domain-containing protein [Flavobacterium agri]NYA72292.1 T9SS type A sorting domain-containing protein [Flavobacterium agri]